MSLAFLFKDINALKRQLKPEKNLISKKRNSESLFSTEINLNTSSDEGEQQKTCLLLLNHLLLSKSSQPVTELILSHIDNYEEHLLRVLSDTGASSSIILEGYTSAPFIKTDYSNTTI
jgi:hypothetical protein